MIKEKQGESFRNTIENIVNVLKKTIQSNNQYNIIVGSNNDNFAVYIKRNFS